MMQFHFLRLILLALVFFIGFSASLLADERTRQALIIGNSKYQKVKRLKNPVNDAMLMNEALREVGFQTTLVTDSSRREMKEAMHEFAKNLNSNSIGLFYYAGHGLEVNGRNYLVPVDASIGSEADVEYETVDAGRMLSIFNSNNNGLNLMILDACRDNPFTDSQSAWRNLDRKGLAAMRPATGSLVIYAAEPGKQASDNRSGHNSLFTKSLVESIRQPGLKIEDVYKKTAITVREGSGSEQTPYLEGAILGDFIFTPPVLDESQEPSGLHESREPADLDELREPPEGCQKKDEVALWKEAKSLNNRAGYECYLSIFPNGTYQEIADMKLTRIGN